MRASPWEAAEAARAHVSDQAMRLLAYADPLVAAIGALALQTGFSSRTLLAIAAEDVRWGSVPSLAGFDAGTMEPWIGTLVSAQVDTCPASSHTDKLLVRTRGGPRGQGRRRRDAVTRVTEPRVNAILRTLQIERELNLDHVAWADNLGIARLTA